MNQAADRQLSRKSGNATLSRREIVEQAEACYRAQPGAMIPIAQLSRLVGLSERGLRNAFYDVRGMSPKRRMLQERLRSVRRALRNRRLSSVTVTSIATDYGFYELGRFAGAYKSMFGESPSDTLRAATRPPFAGGQLEENR
jgi:AraC family ethanolamine operon transcriptional activator